MMRYLPPLAVQVGQPADAVWQYNYVAANNVIAASNFVAIALAIAIAVAAVIGIVLSR
jgi:uncharacterized membrane protein YciS (DUF1049 family)